MKIEGYTLLGWRKLKKKKLARETIMSCFKLRSTYRSLSGGILLNIWCLDGVCGYRLFILENFIETFRLTAIYLIHYACKKMLYFLYRKGLYDSTTPRHFWCL